MYNAEYHLKIEQEEQPFAQRLAMYCALRFPTAAKLVDFGCSTGIYLREFERYVKIPCVGYEYSQDGVVHALTDSVTYGDLTDTRLFPHREWRVLGVCLEVLEHIDDKYWRECLANLSRVDTLIFSAARPGQGGVGHINCQEKMTWVKRFCQFGMVVDIDETINIREFAKQGYHMGWFTQNVMVMRQAKF